MSEPGGDPSSGISSGDALILPERHPACRRREARPGFRMERENTTKAKVATMAAMARNTNFRLAGEAVDPSLPGLQSTVTERGSLGRKKNFSLAADPLVDIYNSHWGIPRCLRDFGEWGLDASVGPVANLMRALSPVCHSTRSIRSGSELH